MSIEIREVGIKRILNPTSIDLGEYVINPYKGCAYSCMYCYVKYNKVTSRDSRCWGDYVDVRINAPSALSKELFIKKPKRVLLGSTTECFQPLERQYRVTKSILEILNENKVYYSILTRSPIIEDYLSLLSEGYCENIYFTVNNYEDSIKMKIEPKTPSFNERINTIKKLQKVGIPVIPYFSPVLPFITNIEEAFKVLPDSNEIGFEGLNFNLGSIGEVISEIKKVHPDIAERYDKMRSNKVYYNNIWNSIRKDVIKKAKREGKEHSVYIHGLNSYFDNVYPHTN